MAPCGRGSGSPGYFRSSGILVWACPMLLTSDSWFLVLLQVVFGYFPFIPFLPVGFSTMSDPKEQTFIAIKPDGVQRGLIGEIIKRFENKGFKLVAMKMLCVSISSPAPAGGA